MSEFIRIHDQATGEITDREMTQSELEDFQAGIELAESRQLAKQELANKKLAVLEKLGLTPEEAAILLG